MDEGSARYGIMLSAIWCVRWLGRRRFDATNPSAIFLTCCLQCYDTLVVSDSNIWVI